MDQKKPKPVKQHTVPKVYLNRFTNEKGLFHVYDIDKRVYRLQPPKTTSVEKDFYTVSNIDGEKNYFIEELMSQYVEKDFGEIIDKFLKTNKLNLSEKEYLALFIAFQHLRTPQYRDQFIDFLDRAYKQTTELALRVYKANYGKTDINTVATEDELDRMIELFEKEQVKFNFHNDKYLKFMMEFVEKEANILLQQNWVFLKAPKSSEFITCDHPFYMSRPKYLPNWSGVGLLTEGSAKVFPLTPKMCVMIMNHGNAELLYQYSREDVRQINLSLGLSAKRFIISREKKLLERIVNTLEFQRKKATSN
ncbi:DUF4238 domain-containing protein [Fictibacillus enclensis]|uniref:DUF4238 domain-containing protein n=1 Tax=Fictibacillus enclensis TaxID=1017270 RepID=UPI00259FFC67|nr:DUF4238 domain-containing protein [Fictibacillus enclensis]MDM5199269.1 DUF4238 domain-containing protein [Fictibacillus enclensis]